MAMVAVEINVRQPLGLGMGSIPKIMTMIVEVETQKMPTANVTEKDT